jgi:hypothetical protein
MKLIETLAVQSFSVSQPDAEARSTRYHKPAPADREKQFRSMVS